MSAPAITRDVSELDLAAQREAFKVLEREWQELDRAQGIKARELRAVRRVDQRARAQARHE
jgi:hypothetical protein